MSGTKTTRVTMDQSEVDTLRRRANSASNMQEELKNQRKRSEKIRSELQANEKAMNKEFKRKLSGLSTQMRNSEARHLTRVSNLQSEFKTAFDQQNSNFSTKLANQGAKFQSDLNTHKREVQRDIQEIQQSLLSEKLEKRQAASQYRNELVSVIQNAIQSTSIERFLPGRLETLLGRVRMSEMQIESGNYEAAIAMNQTIHFDYADLQAEALNLEYEWKMVFDELTQHSETLFSLNTSCRENGERVVFMEGEKRIEVAVDMAFWAAETYPALAQEIDRLELMYQDSSELSTDALRDLSRRMIETHEKLASALSLGRDRIIKSQLRQSIAQNAANAFQNTEWVTVESAYDNNDFRQSLLVRLKNIANEEIVIVVSPDAEEGQRHMANSVDLHYLGVKGDENYDKAAQREHFGLIQDVFNSEGVCQVDDFVCRDNQPEVRQVRRRLLSHKGELGSLKLHN